MPVTLASKSDVTHSSPKTLGAEMATRKQELQAQRKVELV